MDALHGRAGRAAGEDRRRQRLGAASARSTSRWTRCAARRATPTWPRSRAASGAASRSCRLLLSQPDMLLLDEPTNHLDAESVAWLERFLEDYKGTVVAVTHDRYFLDNVAGWILELDRGRGIPYEGNYSGWLEQKRKRLEQEEREEQGAPAHARARAGVDRPEPAGPPRQVARPASPPTRSCSPRRASGRPGSAQIVIPPGPRLGDLVIEADHLTQGLRRPAADRRPRLQAAARRHRRRHRPERRRQDHAVPHDRRPGAAGRAAASASATRSSSATSTRAATRSTPNKTSARRSRAASSRSSSASARCRRAPTSAPSTSRAPTSRRRSASSRAASATGSTWPSC